MIAPLNDIEIRILGCLMEKALSTPDHYPLSLNALTHACNQKSSRDPVVTYTEPDVQAVLEDLEDKGLVNQSRVGRVPKYEERLTSTQNLVPRESAVLCVLMLRGPQTVGQIRGRTGRLCHFASLEAVSETLEKLLERELAQRQARLPGRKEARFRHLLGGQAEPDPSGLGAPPATPHAGLAARIDHLEAELARLSEDLARLAQAFREFKAQFE